MREVAVNLQSFVAMGMVVAAAAWFGRGLLRTLLGRGGCASGGSCGSCRAGGCDVARFEAIRVALEQKDRPRP
ncbi:MAG TPA: hypothetical protein VF804_08055 [Holophagaceae bacterium]